MLMQAALYRWIPAISMLLVSLISYIDRNTLALLAPTILAETGLSGRQYGFIISAFSIAYMIANPLWGRILDRVGLRRGMSLAVFFWTVASASHALASGFMGFAVARAALGFGEGATFPGGLRAVMQTLPPSARGRGIAVAYSGGSLGAIITPIVITPIFLWWGWRPAFLFTGLIGAAWLRCGGSLCRVAPIVRTMKRDETQEMACAQAERRPPVELHVGLRARRAAAWLRAVQRRDLPEPGHGAVPGVHWQGAMDPTAWLGGRLLRVGVALGSDVREVAGRILALRRLMTAAVVMSLPFALIPLLTNVWWVMFGMFLAMFVAAGFVILAVAYATHVFSADHAGLIAGAGAGSWSAMVALMMPLFGQLFDQRSYEIGVSDCDGISPGRISAVDDDAWAGVDRTLNNNMYNCRRMDDQWANCGEIV